MAGKRIGVPPTPKKRSGGPLTSEQLAATIAIIRKRNNQQVRPTLEINQWFSTGVYPLDLMVNQGLPGGRIVELSGPETCGKTTLALSVIREAQRLGGRGDYFDLEVGMTQGSVVSMAQVDPSPDIFEIWRPRSAEDAFQSMTELIPVLGKTQVPCVMVLDSVPACVTIAELKTEFGSDPQMARGASLLGRFCKKNLVPLAENPNVLLILINHVAQDFQVNRFQAPTYHTPGGRSTRYYPSVRLRFEKKGGRDTLKADPKKSKSKEEPAYQAIRTTLRDRVVIYGWKNRHGSGFRSITVPLNFTFERATSTNKGFDDARACLEFLRDEGVLTNKSDDDEGGLSALLGITPSESEDEEDTASSRGSSYYTLKGSALPKRFFRDWVLAYNTSQEISTLIRNAVLWAAQKKWTPDEYEEYLSIPEGDDNTTTDTI